MTVKQSMTSFRVTFYQYFKYTLHLGTVRF